MTTVQWPCSDLLHTAPLRVSLRQQGGQVHYRLPKSPVPWGNWSSEVPKPWMGHKIGSYPPSHASGAFKPSLTTLSRPRLQKKNDWGLFSKSTLPSTGLTGQNRCRRWTLDEEAERRHLPLSLPTCPLTLSQWLRCSMSSSVRWCGGTMLVWVCLLLFRLKENVANIVKRIPVSLWSRFLECYIYHNHSTMIKM